MFRSQEQLCPARPPMVSSLYFSPRYPLVDFRRRVPKSCTKRRVRGHALENDFLLATPRWYCEPEYAGPPLYLIGQLDKTANRRHIVCGRCLPRGPEVKDGRLATICNAVRAAGIDDSIPEHPVGYRRHIFRPIAHRRKHAAPMQHTTRRNIVSLPERGEVVGTSQIDRKWSDESVGLDPQRLAVTPRRAASLDCRRETA